MNSPRICLSLFGSTSEITDAIRKYDADLYEIRLDLSSELNGTEVRAATKKPILFTAHGRPDLLEKFWPFADYVDVEQAEAIGQNTIRSIHSSEEDPDRLWKRLSGEHITKIVLESENYSAILKLIHLNQTHSPRAICFAMGEVGSFSRVVSLFHGARWIYASLPDRNTGPGQFSYEELINTFQIRRFDRNEKVSVFGIIGNPVSHSRSPLIQNQLFAENSLPWLYLPFFVKDLKAFLQNAPEWNSLGFSITHPFKEEVASFLDVSSPEVQTLRSCNTIAYVDGKWHGINTDVDGIRAWLKDIPIENKRIVILGAGASSRAIRMVALERLANVTVLNRTGDQADGSLSDLGKFEYDLLINATPAGWNDGECPVSSDHLRPDKIVLDAIYRDTELLKRARAIGCSTKNGEDWFRHQAEAQFHFWRERFKG